jgi:hypothetical protein
MKMKSLSKNQNAERERLILLSGYRKTGTVAGGSRIGPKSAMSAVVCGMVWLSLTATSSAQVMRPFDSPSRGRYAPMESRQTVSPYVNLTNGNGLSNYQTLVRPLLEERDELNRQWAALDDLNRRVRGTPMSGNQGPNRAGTGAGSATGVRYMHYSHYFGTTR